MYITVEEETPVILPDYENATGQTNIHPCDTAHCAPKIIPFFHSYFDAKTAHDFPRLNSHFDAEKTVYGDAVAGWTFRSNRELVDNWQDIALKWPKGAGFYPTRIIGDHSGAMIFVTDTPEMLGVEIKGIASVEMEGGLIVRWVDYWDSRPLRVHPEASRRTVRGEGPADFGESTVLVTDGNPCWRVCKELHAALAEGNAERAGKLFASDAAFEDMTLRIIIRGRAAIIRFLSRAVRELPYGPGATMIHSLGGAQGGGYEWRACDPDVDRGVTAVELDDRGAISYLAALWDASLLSDQALAIQTAHAFDR